MATYILRDGNKEIDLKTGNLQKAIKKVFVMKNLSLRKVK